MSLRSFSLVLVSFLGAGFCGIAGQAPSELSRINPAGIEGALIIGGGGTLPEKARDHFVSLAGGSKARVAVLLGSDNIAPAKQTAQEDSWKKRGAASVRLVPIDEVAEADDPKTLDPLRAATGVWVAGAPERFFGKQSLAHALGGTLLEKELHALLKRGGVFGGNLLASQEMEFGKDEFLPGVLIFPSYKPGRKTALLKAMVDHPEDVGLGIDRDAALLIKGRDIRVLGDGKATVILGAGAGKPVFTKTLDAKSPADLTTLRRAALARTLPPFPPKDPPIREVPRGSLVIVGGGGMPAEVTKKFIDLAGGPDALIVVLPIADSDGPPKNLGTGLFEKAGAKNVKALTARTLREVEDPKTLDLLKNAGGVWFGGGRQWRFVDAYENTKAHDLFKEVLERGGVLGGSSAGATILGDYLCRGSPLGNLEMMCEGYERGLGFLPGVGIDQHFTQRNRHKDMTALMKKYPQVLGIGIDEATALIVRGRIGEVLGKNRVHFYDPRLPQEAGQPDHESIGPGERYDLRSRRQIP